MKKEYLGDAVYAGWDGYHIVLTTEDGVQTTGRIFLEPRVVRSFMDYAERVDRFVGADTQRQKSAAAAAQSVMDDDYSGLLVTLGAALGGLHRPVLRKKLIESIADGHLQRGYLAQLSDALLQVLKESAPAAAGADVAGGAPA